jgi:threonine/homoserine/homoserine lactone efflux protein
MISILPPFVSLEKSIATQLFILVGIIMICEFICMMLYASGGKSLRALLNKGDNIRWLNRIAGSLLVLVGVWLALG